MSEDISNNHKLKTAEKIAKLEERLDNYISYSNKATELARRELDLRLESMNEFRHQIEIERATYVNKNELELKLDNVRKEIRPLQNQRSFNQGKDWAFGMIIIGISTVIALVLKFFG